VLGAPSGDVGIGRFPIRDVAFRWGAAVRTVIGAVTANRVGASSGAGARARAALVVLVSLAVVASAVVLAPGGAVAEPTSYALGSLDGQHGWNGGIGGFVNNESGAEAVTTADSYSGERSWRYGRGYGSPGQGTPYSPVAATVGRPSSGAAGDVAILRFAFRAVVPGDGSLQSVYLGSVARNDRTGMQLSLRNLGGGVDLAMSRMSGVGCNTESVVLSTVSGATWHTVEMRSQLHEDVDLDVTTYIVDGVEIGREVAWPMPWRVCNGFDYTPGSSIKLMSTSPNTPAFSGFYYDDMSLQVVSSSAGETVGFFGTGDADRGGGDGRGDGDVLAASVRRRERDHRLHGGEQPGGRGRSAGGEHEPQPRGDGTRQRHVVHVHRRGHQRRRHRPALRRVERRRADRADHDHDHDDADDHHDHRHDDHQTASDDDLDAPAVDDASDHDADHDPAADDDDARTAGGDDDHHERAAAEPPGGRRHRGTGGAW
jgi:hypothetical protein